MITVLEPSWLAPFTGPSPRHFGKLTNALRREGADPVRKGRPWSLPLEDRVLLVAAYWRTNLTLRQLAPLFGVSKSAADRIIDHLGPALALQQRKRFRKDTVLIVDGTLVPTRDHTIAEQSKNYRYSTITRSSSTPTPGSSSRSASHCPATATTARRGSCPAPRMPSGRRW
ncbi:DDE superfamily endonuclease [Streptomyces sp. 2333.5]|nr:DDE superfamily endonuclease [Streptomyces sp. 2333.5]SEE71477.1 Helix-turn-helix of DDE superfamily endonuclease [Streptomyces sp. 2112.2]